MKYLTHTLYLLWWSECTCSNKQPFLTLLMEMITSECDISSELLARFTNDDLIVADWEWRDQSCHHRGNNAQGYNGWQRRVHWSPYQGQTWYIHFWGMFDMACNFKRVWDHVMWRVHIILCNYYAGSNTTKHCWWWPITLEAMMILIDSRHKDCVFLESLGRNAVWGSASPQ